MSDNGEDKIVFHTNDEFEPCSPVPHTGVFEDLSSFVATTQRAAFAMNGGILPAVPLGFVWRPLRVLSVAELRQRAEQYRDMAATARTVLAKEGLLKLADRFDGLADRRERGEGSTGEVCRN